MNDYRPIAPGDVVAVENDRGAVAYFGEVESLPDPEGDAALFDRGHAEIFSPETGETHRVPTAYAGLRLATAEEVEAYWAKYGEPGSLLGPEAPEIYEVGALVRVTPTNGQKPWDGRVRENDRVTPGGGWYVIEDASGRTWEALASVTSRRAR